MMALALVVLLAADLAAVKSEPVPVKRAVKAFDLAFEELAEARKAASENEFDKVKDRVGAIAEAVEAGRDALSQGKRNQGQIKKAEQRCRDLLRRLETLRQDLPFDERAPVEEGLKRVQSVQDRLVAMVMGRSK